MHARATGVSLLLLTLTACGDEEPPRALVSDVDALAASGVVGVQVEQLIDGTRHWASAGVSDLHRRSPILPNSRYRIASTSKAFVAALTLRLVDAGLLALDDCLEHWLPGIAEGSEIDAGSITLRHLLSHRSGIANYVDDLQALLAEASSNAAFMAVLQQRWSPTELVALAFAHGALAEPGRAFRYSDTNYVLIGMIIEAATGQRWEEALAEHVLEPLMLRHTFAPGEMSTLPGAYMHGYATLPFHEGYRDVTPLNPSALDAAAALVSTPSDVNTFFAALLGGELVSAEALREMKSLEPVSDQPDAPSYGLGLMFMPLPCGGGYYAHPGDTFGFHTRNAVSEDGRRSVCIAISGDGDFDPASDALIARLMCPRVLHP
jgi:D-alanyl-D-alanine carboxypeptidase